MDQNRDPCTRTLQGLICPPIPEIDDDRVLERHLALIPVISQYDVIFMQEVIPESWQTIKANMQNYLHFEGISTGQRVLDDASSGQTHQNQSRPILAFSQALTVRVYVGEILKEILRMVLKKIGTFPEAFGPTYPYQFEGSLDRSKKRTFRNCDKVNNIRALERPILCNDINKEGILR